MTPPGVARLDRRTATPAAAEWRAYWERLQERAIFPVEAADYVARLAASVGIEPGARVLDVGCGFGFVAALLAARVREVVAWDASAHMRRAATRRLARHRNAHVVPGPEPHLEGRRFDLVLVNSVAQYMTGAELDAWLARAPGLLAPRGRLVLSDLLTGPVSPLHELAELLALSARGGVLRRILWQGLCELRHYARTRHARPLTRIDLDDLARRAAARGLALTVLDRNLAYRAGRASVVLSVPAAEGAR